MKKIILSALLILVCVTAFISCNSDTSLLTAVYRSAPTVDERQQSLIGTMTDPEDSTLFDVFYISENGITKAIVNSETYKLTKTAEVIVANEATAQVTNAYMINNDTKLYYLTSGYDSDAKLTIAKYWSLDLTTNKTTDITSTITGTPVYLSFTNGNVYTKEEVDAPFKGYTSDTDYQTCRFMLESDSALLLSNEKWWFLYPNGTISDDNKIVIANDSKTDIINTSKLGDEPVVFEKISDSMYWIICGTYSYTIKVEDKTASLIHQESSPFSGTRMLTFESATNGKIFMKYVTDYSTLYGFDKTQTSLKSGNYTTYSLSSALEIIDIIPTSTDNQWIAATLDSGLYKIVYTGSTFTATSMTK